MQKVRFSTSDLPPTLGDQAKLEAFRKFYGNFYTSLDMERVEDRPFVITVDAAQVGRFRLGRIDGTLRRISRTEAQIVDARNNDFLITINIAPSPVDYSQ